MPHLKASGSPSCCLLRCSLFGREGILLPSYFCRVSLLLFTLGGWVCVCARSRLVRLWFIGSRDMQIFPPPSSGAGMRGAKMKRGDARTFSGFFFSCECGNLGNDFSSVIFPPGCFPSTPARGWWPRFERAEGVFAYRKVEYSGIQCHLCFLFPSIGGGLSFSQCAPPPCLG